jgi:hypothetical protein
VRLVVSFLESYSKLDLNNPCVRNNILSDWWSAVMLDMMLSP